MDPDDETAVKLSLGGDDADSFKLGDPAAGTGAVELTFKDSPNYESPTDVGMDNTYNVSIVATDDEGLTGMKALIIKVTNVQEPGKVSILPVQPAIGQVVTATLTDEDGEITGAKWQWSSSGTEIGGYTNIEGATTSSYTPRAKSDDVDATPDVDEGYAGDEGKFLRATVTYKDGATLPDDEDDSTMGDQPATVMKETTNAVREVPDVNTAPYFMDDPVELKVKETADKGDAAGTVMAEDDESDVLTYTLSGGADMASFKVSPGGEVTVNTDLDYDAGQRMYTIEVTAADPFGMSGTGTVTIEVEDVNEEPVVMGEVSEDGYDENGIDAVATFTASDEDNDPLKWGLEGADAEDFSIEGGVLAFKKSPDFENPTDRGRAENDDTEAIEQEADNNNAYLVTITATEDVSDREEGETNLKGSKAVTVTVNNVEEDGTVTITLRQPEVGTELTASTTDLDVIDGTVTYQWSIPKVNRPILDEDTHWQDSMGGGNGTAIYTPNANDESKYLRVKASYTDGKDMDVAYVMTEFTVREDVLAADNAPPAFATDDPITREIPEDAAVGTEVGDPVAATDPDSADSGKLTYSLSGDDASSFSIDRATGQITVAMMLDAEEGATSTDGEYDVTVTATDPSGESGQNNDTLDVDITATDVDEPPGVMGENATTAAVTMHEINEDENLADETDYVAATGFDATVDAAAQYIATITDTEADPAEEVSLKLGGDDASAFKLLDVNGETAGTAHALLFKSDPNYESPDSADGSNTYKVDVIAVDKAGNEKAVSVTVVVNNVQEAGTVSVVPGQPGIEQEVTATLTDQDGGETDVKWQWYGVSTKPADSDDPDDIISFSELTGPRLIEGATMSTYTPRAEIKDNDATEDVDESYPGDEGDFLVATVSYKDAATPEADDDATEDVDESAAASILGAADNAVRAVPLTNTDPYFEDDPVELTVLENVDKGDPVDTVSAKDDENDALEYSLSGGADMASFKVSSGGEVTVNTDLDYDAGQRMYTIMVTATDPFGGSGSTTVTIEVEDVNEQPTLGINAAPVFADDMTERSVEENTAAGEPIGDPVTATDDRGALTYTLGGDDMASFAIDDASGQISVGEGTMLDYETKSIYSVTVKATDNTNASNSITVTITVTGVNEAPSFDALQAELMAEVVELSVDENTEAGMAVGDPVAAMDVDAGDTLTYSLDEMGEMYFEIDPMSGQLMTEAALDYESGTTSYSVTVTAADSDGLNDSIGVTIAVEDMNEAPVFASAMEMINVDENTPVGTDIGDPITATDEDEGATLTYSLGGDDAASFAIDAATGQLMTMAALDHETKSSYTVTVHGD